MNWFHTNLGLMSHDQAGGLSTIAQPVCADHSHGCQGQNLWLETTSGGYFINNNKKSVWQQNYLKV